MSITLEEVEQLKQLIGNAEAALAAAKKHQQVLAAYASRLTLEPCKLCGRRVSVPCDTRENMRESGPWDFSCETRR